MERVRGVGRPTLVCIGILAGLAAQCATAPIAGAAYPGVNGKIAFSSGRDGNYEVYSMDAAGVTQTNLTGNPAGDLFAAWSPNGQKIAFASFRDGGDEEIYVMNADGTNQTRLTNSPGADAMPTWSPDGHQIAFRSDRDGGDFEIYVMNADGSGQTNLTNHAGVDNAPAWSPGGSKIAFETTRDGDWEIYTMNADGTNQVDLTSDPGNDRRPSWSPYADRIAFDSARDGNLEIYSMKPDGSAQTRLTSNTADDSEPAWSPDGAKITFRSQRDGNAEIYSMSSNGSAQTRLTNNLDYDNEPDWQPTSPGYARPKGASPLRTSLVPAYQPCTSPNRTHGAPLAFPSCNPPAQASGFVTVGTPDANGAAPNFVGSMVFTSVVGVPGPPDDSDLDIDANVTDIRCTAAVLTCVDGPLSDYTGQLQAGLMLRITDRLNGPSTADAATVTDTPFPVTLGCAPTVQTTTGSVCSVHTSINTLTPGAIKDTKRTTVQLDQVQVTDGGPDGTASTADNTLFAVQGLFVP